MEKPRRILRFNVRFAADIGLAGRSGGPKCPMMTIEGA
jgi:hypothetical protein